MSNNSPHPPFLHTANAPGNRTLQPTLKGHFPPVQQPGGLWAPASKEASATQRHEQTLGAQCGVPREVGCVGKKHHERPAGQRPQTLCTPGVPRAPRPACFHGIHDSWERQGRYQRPGTQGRRSHQGLISAPSKSPDPSRRRWERARLLVPSGLSPV
jgi:hypothetical protein